MTHLRHWVRRPWVVYWTWTVDGGQGGPMPARRGSVLLELVVVCGIAGIVAGIVWLADPLAGRLALRAAAATLVTDLRVVQARAIAERDPARAHGVQFFPGRTHYLIITRTDGLVAPLRERRLPPRVRVRYARFGGVTPSTVIFTGVSLFGAPSGGGTVTLTAGTATLCVRLAPATGRIRVANTGCP